MLVGDHLEEKRGVVVDVKKTIDMDDIGIIVESEDMV